ncbi:hypothetical protein PoB_002460000 [Plakobranchus ocellatus]|uniref:Uncharacterized protein n=1 Tax=Plakobranchus ocellatus TaxID=259542 RepID=A0AAV3ZTY9_9GAST|nr:hypothetical protein PoB_002460000 [Plakobranchus ocellatus]
MATQLVQYMDLRLTIDNNPPAYEFGPGHIRPTHAPHTNYIRQAEFFFRHKKKIDKEMALEFEIFRFGLRTEFEIFRFGLRTEFEIFPFGLRTEFEMFRLGLDYLKAKFKDIIMLRSKHSNKLFKFIVCG